MTYPHPTASDDYSSHTSRDNEYRSPAPTGTGQPDPPGDQSGGGHRRFRRGGPFSRLLHRGQPTGAPAGAPTAAAAGAPTAAAAGAPTAAAAGTPTGHARRRDANGHGGRGANGSGGRGANGSGAGRGAADAQGVRTTGVQVLASHRGPGHNGPGDPGDPGGSASPAGPPNAAPSDLAAANPGAASAAPRPSGYRPQHRASRSEQPGISSASASASAQPDPDQLGIGEANERLDPDQAAREHLAGSRLDEARRPGVPRDSDRAGRDTSPMPPFPGSARSRAAVPAPFADWVAGRVGDPGRPVNATGSFPGRPVPPMPAGSVPSAPRFVMPAPTFASSTASSAGPPTGSSAVCGSAAPPPGPAAPPPPRPPRPAKDRFPAGRRTRIQTATRCAGSWPGWLCATSHWSRPYSRSWSSWRATRKTPSS